jgi:hypothetical protein
MIKINDKIGVHKTHCCLSHGCKYGDENCPVELGHVVQDYECESCSYEREDIEHLLKDEKQFTYYLERLAKYSKNSKVTKILQKAIEDMKALDSQ